MNEKNLIIEEEYAQICPVCFGKEDSCKACNGKGYIVLKRTYIQTAMKQPQWNMTYTPMTTTLDKTTTIYKQYLVYDPDTYTYITTIEEKSNL